MCKGDKVITLISVAACFSPRCRSCLLARCCGSACSCPCRWRDSCGWSNAAARSGWPGLCTGGGGAKRSRSEPSGGRWWAEGNDRTMLNFTTVVLCKVCCCRWKRTHPIHLDDLELLGDVGWVGRQPGPAADKAQEKHPLLVGELLQALPEPGDQLVALGDVAVTHQLLQHLHGDLRQAADQLLQLLRCQQGEQGHGDDGGHALSDCRHLDMTGRQLWCFWDEGSIIISTTKRLFAEPRWTLSPDRTFILNMSSKLWENPATKHRQKSGPKVSKIIRFPHFALNICKVYLPTVFIICWDETLEKNSWSGRKKLPKILLVLWRCCCYCTTILSLVKHLCGNSRRI